MQIDVDNLGTDREPWALCHYVASSGFLAADSPLNLLQFEVGKLTTSFSTPSFPSLILSNSAFIHTFKNQVVIAAAALRAGVAVGAAGRRTRTRRVGRVGACHR